MFGDVSFGTWTLPNDVASAAIATALRVGFRSIDTAAAYANERGIGCGIREAGMDRASLFVSGKLWVTRRAHDAALKACKKSLKSLGLDYFDRYLIHWPASPALHEDAVALNDETWGALNDLLRSGAAASIGVCNFSASELSALISRTGLVPSVNQIEMHPGHYPLDTIKLCRDFGIEIEAWSPLGHGSVLAHPLIGSIAEHAGCTPAQVCLKWCIERGASPIVGTSSEAHMVEALRLQEVALDEGDLQLIDDMEACGFSGVRSEADLLKGEQ